MWQLSPNDLPTLSRRDRGLLFNYFGARAGATYFSKVAAVTAAGYFGLGLVQHLVSSAFPASADTPGWVLTMRELAPIGLTVAAVLSVAYPLWRARAARLVAAELACELERRELDVSRLTEDQVFEKVVLPMVRSAGIPVDDD
jgi:hypothetical protein